ncbi:14 kDa phosphohistidine phosphatase-like [Athalia rosae]|uniref:14 kDa phosphohistidine phosphatase-like n=1 Tax=Athalia rosae TaxID=37344 RepID=UPI002033292C|nr:14 kDa phosphohistidine phosphatase-like [Athalia rosae]XP_048505027.1 14 kDa phosphohistidine phosphatase-like [Athalia rosae]
MEKILEAIPDVDIDDNGTFKYILIDVYGKDDSIQKVILRGYLRDYHMTIFEEVEEKIQKISKDIRMDCPGGGFIQHNAAAKKIKVYGKSIGYGAADHKVAVKLLQKAYPDYEVITTNED